MVCSGGDGNARIESSLHSALPNITEHILDSHFLLAEAFKCSFTVGITMLSQQTLS